MGAEAVRVTFNANRFNTTARTYHFWQGNPHEPYVTIPACMVGLDSASPSRDTFDQRLKQEKPVRMGRALTRSIRSSALRHLIRLHRAQELF
jgi:hypothetical protein